MSLNIYSDFYDCENLFDAGYFDSDVFEDDQKKKEKTDSFLEENDSTWTDSNTSNLSTIDVPLSSLIVPGYIPAASSLSVQVTVPSNALNTAPTVGLRNSLRIEVNVSQIPEKQEEPHKAALVTQQKDTAKLGPKEKIEKRKESNKLSARRSRMDKKVNLQSLLEEETTLRQTMRNLDIEMAKLIGSSQTTIRILSKQAIPPSPTLLAELQKKTNEAYNTILHSPYIKSVDEKMRETEITSTEESQVQESEQKSRKEKNKLSAKKTRNIQKLRLENLQTSIEVMKHRVKEIGFLKTDLSILQEQAESLI